MVISYNKLWKLLIDKKMKIKLLQSTTVTLSRPVVSSATLAKMKKGENVNTEIAADLLRA